MIKKIRVRGYQSLYDVEVECQGFTVIYGESDVGKSAFYRAIRAFLTAESGDSFISYGEDVAEVSLDLDIGLGVTVTWKKKRGRSCDYNRKYVCGDLNWLRCKSMPEEIARDLKINPIILDGEKFYPNLRGQFDSLFMLFESSAKRARLLGSLISNILLQGVREANLERYRNEADVRAFQELLVELEKKSKFDYPTFKAKVDSCRVILENLVKATQYVGKLSTYYAEKCRLSKYQHLQPPEFVSREWFEETDKMVSYWFNLSTACSRQVMFKSEIESIGREILEVGKKIDATFAERVKVASQLTIPCPNCGTKISLTEVQL